MDPLFIEQVGFEKMASRMLSEDPTKWTKEVLDEFFTEFPYFMSQNVNLEFKKRKDEKGYAVGTIDINNLSVPVIINNYELAPFDLVYSDGIILPLRQETLGALMNSKDAFKQIVSPDDDNSKVDLLFQRPLIDMQPTPGLNKHSSLKKSMIDMISDTITVDHKKELLAKLANKNIRAGFELNGTVSVLAKIAEVTPVQKSYFKESLAKTLPQDIHYIEKISRFQYKGTFGNSDIYDPVQMTLSADQISDYDLIKGVGTDIEKKAEYSVTKGAAFKIDGRHEKLVLMTQDGMRKHAYLDVAESSADSCDSTFRGEMPMIGDYGVWAENNTASKPFEITAMTKMARNYSITGSDGFTTKTYYPVRSVDKETPHESEKNAFYVPASARFVKIGEHSDITTKKNDFTPSNYFTKDSAGYYALNGPVFAKYAELSGKTTNTMTLSEASWASLQCKASKESVEKLASAHSNIRMPFECELDAPISIDKLASHLENKYDKDSQTIKKLAVNLIKEASVISDPNSVDAVLALNMVTRENILEFVTQLPMYEQVLSDLAKMLLMARMGLSAIPQQALSRAMTGLSQVVEVLRGMSSLNKNKPV